MMGKFEIHQGLQNRVARVHIRWREGGAGDKRDISTSVTSRWFLMICEGGGSYSAASACWLTQVSANSLITGAEYIEAVGAAD